MRWRISKSAGVAGLLGFLCAAGLGSGCGNGSKTPGTTQVGGQATTDMMGHAFEGKAYVLEFPSDWDTQRKAMGADLIGYAPLEGPNDKYRENLSILLERSGDKDIDAYAQANIESMKTLLAHFVYAEPVPATVGALEGRCMDYSYTLGQVELEGRIYFVLDNGHAYALTCSTEKGKREAFLPKFEEVIKTFALK